MEIVTRANKQMEGQQTWWLKFKIVHVECAFKNTMLRLPRSQTNAMMLKHIRGPLHKCDNH